MGRPRGSIETIIEQSVEEARLLRERYIEHELETWIQKRMTIGERKKMFPEMPTLPQWNTFRNRRKYKATLLSLKKEPLRIQAQKLKMSHMMLRKWRCEDSFKYWVRRHEQDFVEYLDNLERKNHGAT
jgi:hypothetical protein